MELKFLRKRIDKVKPHFEKGGKWERFYYVFEAFETFAFGVLAVGIGGKIEKSK